ncbi:MAG: DUF4097 family beta strand repeat protein [Oscillospiraceae bacterium]|nr:DUF4097 family beta strand repeat protein [Oscillospiraceae bacterium]
MRGKSWLTAASILILAGLCICVTAYRFLGFDFSGPTKKGADKSSGSMVTNTYDVKKDFQNIDIDADTESIVFVPAKDGKCTVVCVEYANEPHDVRVEGSTLKVDRTERKTGFHIGIVTETETITVYLPEKAYEDLEVETDTGDVEIPQDFSFRKVEIETDTGDITCRAPQADRLSVKTDTGETAVSGLKTKELKLEAHTGGIDVSDVQCSGDMSTKQTTGKAVLKDVTCRNLNSEADTGDLRMKNVIAKDTFTIERTTGDVQFDGCDAETIYVTTDTGEVSGTLLSDKVFLTETDTGKVDTPKSIKGGRCEITTDTGDITLDVKK